MLRLRCFEGGRDGKKRLSLRSLMQAQCKLVLVPRNAAWARAKTIIVKATIGDDCDHVGKYSIYTHLDPVIGTASSSLAQRVAVSDMVNLAKASERNAKLCIRPAVPKRQSSKNKLSAKRQASSSRLRPNPRDHLLQETKKKSSTVEDFSALNLTDPRVASSTRASPTESVTSEADSSIGSPNKVAVEQDFKDNWVTVSGRGSPPVPTSPLSPNPNAKATLPGTPLQYDFSDHVQTKFRTRRASSNVAEKESETDKKPSSNKAKASRARFEKSFMKRGSLQSFQRRPSVSLFPQASKKNILPRTQSNVSCSSTTTSSSSDGDNNASYRTYRESIDANDLLDLDVQANENVAISSIKAKPKPKTVIQKMSSFSPLTRMASKSFLSPRGALKRKLASKSPKSSPLSKSRTPSPKKFRDSTNSGEAEKERSNPLGDDRGKDITAFIEQVCDVYQYNDSRDASHVQVKTPPFIFKPDAFSRVVWELIVMSLVVFYLYAVPLRFCFQVRSELMTPAANAFDDLADFLFIIDVILNFRTAYVNELGKLITDPKKVALHYLFTWAALDIAASIPFSWIVVDDAGSEVGFEATTDANKIAKMSKTLKVLRLLKLIRLLRIFRLLRYFSRLERAFRWNPSNLRFFESFFVLLTTWHYIGCFYWLISTNEYGGYEYCRVANMSNATLRPNCFARECISQDGCLITNTSQIFTGYTSNRDEWVPHASLAAAPLVTQYLQAIFWAVEVTTSVGNDIIPLTNAETVYTLITTIIGLIIYAVIIGSASSAFQNMDSITKVRKTVLETVEKSLKRFNLPDFFTSIILRYYEHMWSCPSDGIAELAVLPPTLKLRLSLVLNRDLFNKIPFFSNLNAKQFVQIVQILVPHTYLPGEYVARRGDIIDTMYIIQRGEVDIIEGNSADSVDKERERRVASAWARKMSLFGSKNELFRILETKHSGDYYGEALFLEASRSTVHAHDARSVDFCDMLLLHKSAFKDIESTWNIIKKKTSMQAAKGHEPPRHVFSRLSIER